MKLKQKVAKA